MTAYCHCEQCCSQFADGITASGAPVKEGVTCASNLYPFGTELEIDGVGRRIVQDRMSKRFPNRVDIYFKSHDEALKFGKRKLKVTVTKKGTQ